MFDHKPEIIVIEDWERPESQLLKHIINELRETNHLLKEFIMATVPAGLAALQQSLTDVTSAVSAAAAKIADLASQLSAVNSEDPAVQNIAAQFEAQATALNAAVNPPAPPAA